MGSIFEKADRAAAISTGYVGRQVHSYHEAIRIMSRAIRRARFGEGHAIWIAQWKRRSLSATP